MVRWWTIEPKNDSDEVAKFFEKSDLLDVMAETHSTKIDWTGSAKMGNQLANSVPPGLKSELIIEGDLATLSVTIKCESLERLRTIVDEVLALFGQEEDSD
ncbi:MAG: hypothetical protein CXT71_04430 [Methanobacteriota archaeon]|nr:MAG: hypothetical protein CXT71_04430 [Euryarchaeota archaeon]